MARTRRRILYADGDDPPQASKSLAAGLPLKPARIRKRRAGLGWGEDEPEPEPEAWEGWDGERGRQREERRNRRKEKRGITGLSRQQEEQRASLLGFMQCKAAETAAVSLCCTAPLNSSYRSADRPGAVVCENSTCTCQYCTHIQQVGGEICLLALTCSRWIAVAQLCSTVWPCHSPSPINTPLALCLDEPRESRLQFPTPSGRISRYRTWQGPNGLASLDRDPVRLRNTVRPDAALPPCRHYEHQNSMQAQRFHGVGPCLACIDSLAGDFRCQTRRRARARRAAELHQTTCRIDADARAATCTSAASQPDRLRLHPLQRTGSCSRLQAAKRPPQQAGLPFAR